MNKYIQERVDAEFANRLKQVANRINEKNGTSKRYTMPLMTRALNVILDSNELFDRYAKEVEWLIKNVK